MRHAASSRPTQRGFTLMEVMIGLALLGVALTVLIK
nr:type II secretion system protein [Deltaproteobacteria bacterium]